MNLSRNTKIAALSVIVVALAVAGGAFAAGQFHGSKSSTAARGLAVGSYASSGSTRPHYGFGFRFGGPDRGPGDDLAAAASYLGVSTSDLMTQLQAGKALAQIANATSGKSAAGLIDALVTHEKAELAQAVKDGRITQAQADQIAGTLKDRFTNLVNGTLPARPFGDHGHGLGPGDDLAAAASYLGISSSDLMTQLQAGKTLAQIANATSGKSAAGLIDALVTHERAELAQAVKGGRITQAQADQITGTLKDRLTNLVNGVRPERPWGVPGSPAPSAGFHI